jgi:thiol-disulfide isomerase/thioredoxin
MTVCVIILLGVSAQASGISKITDIKGRYLGSDGNSQTISELKGKPVLVTFWASWCMPCLMEIPTLNDIHQKYSGRGLQVIGINIDAPSTDEVKRLAEKYRMRYKVGLARDELIQELAINAIPMSFLFSSDGQLHRMYAGQPPAAVLTADIDKAVAKQP